MMPMKVTSAILVEVYATADCNVYLLVYCSLLSRSEMKNVIVARRNKLMKKVVSRKFRLHCL